MKDQGVQETDSVLQGDIDHYKVAPHKLGHNTVRHMVHRKHHSDQCNAGWRTGHRRRVHHRDDFHMDDLHKDGHKSDQDMDGWHMEHRIDRCSADLGMDCMAGHNKDHHRVEEDDDGTQAPQLVFSGWTALVCTQ